MENKQEWNVLTDNSKREASVGMMFSVYYDSTRNCKQKTKDSMGKLFGDGKSSNFVVDLPTVKVISEAMLGVKMSTVADNVKSIDVRTEAMVTTAEEKK